MKQFFKNICYILVATSVLASCSDENKSMPAPELVGAKLLTFGFYAEDNDGQLDKDYLVDGVIVGGEIDIKMPSNINKAKLVARFTTSDDNPTVMVNGETQVSGQTANDYNVPVDFVLSNTEKNNRKYTIRVKKPIEWAKKVSIFSKFKVTDAKIKVNPINNIPYVMVVKDGSKDEKKAALFMYDEEEWKQVGEDISEGQASEIDFTFDFAGNPYVVYQDFLSPIKAKSATVKYYDGREWLVVGRDFQDVATQHNSICFDGNGTLFVFSSNNTDGILNKTILNISTFSNGIWTANQTLSGRPYFSYSMQSVLKNNVLYLAINDIRNDKGTISVYANKNGEWLTLAEGMRHSDATEVNYTSMALDVDNNDNVFVMGLERLSSGYKLILHNYSKDSKIWSIYGTPIDLIANTKYFSMKLDKQGFPAVFYNNLTSKSNASFVTIDKESRVWTSPYLFEDTMNSGTVDLAFDTKGKGYAIYMNADKNIVLSEYAEEDNN